MAHGQDIHDLVIVGDTPAGASAGIRACRAGMRCLLLCTESATSDGRLDWLGPKGIALCRACGLDAAQVHAGVFTGLELYSWDLQHRARVQDKDLKGWIVDAGVFRRELVDAAVREGAELREGRVCGVMLGEDHVTLELDAGEAVQGRVLVITDGMESPTAALARLVTARRAEGVSPFAELVFEGAEEPPRLDVVIGARREPQSVTVLRDGKLGRVTLVSRETGLPLERQLSDFVQQAQACGLLPKRLEGRVRTGLTPAGVALDMETLVGKRCLLAGETGGFAAAFSNETLYPEMQSGWVAAEAARRALEADVLQDALQGYSPEWRAELAEYLRLPNTDLALLMPLVFSNAQMSARVARAFLLGQSF